MGLPHVTPRQPLPHVVGTFDFWLRWCWCWTCSEVHGSWAPMLEVSNALTRTDPGANVQLFCLKSSSTSSIVWLCDWFLPVGRIGTQGINRDSSEPDADCFRCCLLNGLLAGTTFAQTTRIEVSNPRVLVELQYPHSTNDQYPLILKASKCWGRATAAAHFVAT